MITIDFSKIKMQYPPEFRRGPIVYCDFSTAVSSDQEGFKFNETVVTNMRLTLVNLTKPFRLQGYAKGKNIYSTEDIKKDINLLLAKGHFIALLNELKKKGVVTKITSKKERRISFSTGTTEYKIAKELVSGELGLVGNKRKEPATPISSPAAVPGLFRPVALRPPAEKKRRLYQSALQLAKMQTQPAAWMMASTSAAMAASSTCSALLPAVVQAAATTLPPFAHSDDAGLDQDAEGVGQGGTPSLSLSS